jgi:putative ABC transport system substrate-binding protein
MAIQDKKETSDMLGINKSRYRLILMVAAALLGMTLAACGNEKIKTYTVGVINIVPDFDKILAGFKEGMAELGYLEGKKIRYLYDGPTTEMGKLSAAVQSLLAAKVDLILTMTTPATLAAKKATSGTGLPVVFAVVTDPLQAGIVDSMQHPGGNITGVAFGIQEARRLEWLVRIAPEIKQIYVPFNPKDKSPVLALKIVKNAATKLGVTLITREVHDPETLNDAVLHIPSEADAVFLLPDSLVSTRLPDIVAKANERNLPTSGANISVVESNHVLTSFGFSQHLCGKQAARLADQIFKGAGPADLPVEMAEFYLAINLKVAKTIGLTIPDEILRQTGIIIR